MNEGLRLLTTDERDFNLGALYTLPKLEELPVHFTIEGGWLKNQGSTDYCTANATCTAIEPTEGVELEPGYLFMMSKVMTGDPERFGQNLRDIAKAVCKYGALPVADSPLHQAQDDDFKVRNVQYWGDIQKLEDKAIIHKQSSYAFISGPYDVFDNIRATLFSQKKRIIFGTLWAPTWSLGQRVMEDVPTSGFGHCMCIIGFTFENGKQYLVVQGSNGDNMIGGRHLFSREIINHFADNKVYGALAYTDISKEEAQNYIEHGVKIDSGWATQVIFALQIAIIKLLKQLVAYGKTVTGVNK
jgi:hypothetical protein